MANRKFEARLASDKSRAALEFIDDNGLRSSIEMDADQIMALMEGLAQVRANMLPEIPENFRSKRVKGDGNAILTDPKIEIVKLSNKPFRIMAIRSAAYGWIAVVMKDEDVDVLVSQLTSRTDLFCTTPAGNA